MLPQSLPPGFCMRRWLSAAALVLTLATWAPAQNRLMPVPAEMTVTSGRLSLTPAFAVAVHGCDDARLRAGLERWLRWTQERTGLTFARPPGSGPAAALVI